MSDQSAKPVDPKKIDGTAHAKAIRESIKETVATLSRAPSLHVVIVGDRPDSKAYVRMKVKGCDEVGFTSKVHTLPADVTHEGLTALVDSLAEDEGVDGILVQLPLPSHLCEKAVLAHVPVSKDVDGFHQEHMGNLALRGHDPLFVPCTAKGCIELLKRENVPIEGARAVVVGRSNIVGLPVALLLLNENATVTVVHSRTKDLANVCKEADILIVAIGKRGVVTKECVKPGAIVIDVGIHRVDDDSRKSGFRMVGDTDYKEIIEVAEKATPVPGGVGPMTIAMLLSNTLDSFYARTK